MNAIEYEDFCMSIIYVVFFHLFYGRIFIKKKKASFEYEAKT